MRIKAKISSTSSLRMHALPDVENGYSRIEVDVFVSIHTSYNGSFTAFNNQRIVERSIVGGKNCFVASRPFKRSGSRRFYNYVRNFLLTKNSLLHMNILMCRFST